MSQTMPEVLDYRNLMGKLARIDSEWESLKGMLSFRSPHKKEEPIKPTVTEDVLPLDRDNNVVGFPNASAPVNNQTGLRKISGSTAVTPEELEALTPKNEPYDFEEALTPNDGHYNCDEALTARLLKVERQIHRITLLGIAFMALIIALLAFVTFLMVQNHAVNWPAVAQDKQITAPSHPGRAEARVTESELQASSVAAMPTGEVGQSSDTETSPPAAEDPVHFVGSMSSNKIHSPDCKWAKNIKPQKLITFPSVAAAQEQGYLPCPVCRPHD